MTADTGHDHGGGDTMPAMMMKMKSVMMKLLRPKKVMNINSIMMVKKMMMRSKVMMKMMTNRLWS